MEDTQLNFVQIPPSQLGGAIAVNVFALLSALALASVLLRAAWLVIRLTWFKTSPSQAQEIVFFHTQLGNYAACLVLGLLFNGISGMIGFQWLMQRGITEGWTCRIQALFMQMGNFSTAYFTIAIAMHTFNSLVIQRRQSVVICRTTISIGWILTIGAAVAPFVIRLPEGYIYGPGEMVCGVQAVYPKLQFVFHLLPILLASFLGTLMYSLIFLVLRGSLKIKSGVRLTLDPNARWHSNEGVTESYHRFIARVAKSMLWYPIAYIAFLVPYAVTRLFMISGFAVPFQAVVFASVCWFSLSVVDVFLLYNTFRVLGPAFDACSTVSTRKSMILSGNLDKHASSAMPGSNLDMMQKINHYRSQSTTPLAVRNSSSSVSSRQILPLYSSFGRNSEMSSESVLGRTIASRNDYQWEDASRSPSAPPLNTTPRHLNQQLSSHSRSVSSSSLGLPAPPRPSRSPPPLTLHVEPPQMARVTDGGVDNEQWLNHQRSTHTFGRQHSSPSRTSSIYSDGVMTPQSSMWSSRSFGQRLHRTPSGPMVVSSQTANFPAYVTSPKSLAVPNSLERSLSAFSAAAGPPPTTVSRPIAQAHQPRSSSVDANEAGPSATPHYVLHDR